MSKLSRSYDLNKTRQDVTYQYLLFSKSKRVIKSIDDQQYVKLKWVFLG